MTDAVVVSYEYVRRIARTKAKNFYYSFLLLPQNKRDAMCAIYAFMRVCDDLSDEETGEPLEQRLRVMEAWRDEMHAALRGESAEHPVWPAFADTVARFKIPHEYFDDMIKGVTSDLEYAPMATFDDLYRYCYRVASVVGLTIIHIFGFDGPRALELAEKCGIAFQLTNILRDVKEDADRGRVYLPQDELARFGVDLTRPESASFHEFMTFQAHRARGYYAEALPLIGMVHGSSRSSLWALIEVYRRLLERIIQSNFAVMERRIRLSTAEKVGILLQAKLRFAFQ